VTEEACGSDAPSPPFGGRSHGGQIVGRHRAHPSGPPGHLPRSLPLTGEDAFVQFEYRAILSSKAFQLLGETRRSRPITSGMRMPFSVA